MTHLAEKNAPSACPACGHRAIWHHDERGCQYHGNGTFRCACRRTSDEVVSRILADHCRDEREAALRAIAPDPIHRRGLLMSMTCPNAGPTECDPHRCWICPPPKPAESEEST